MDKALNTIFTLFWLHLSLTFSLTLSPAVGHCPGPLSRMGQS